MTQVKWGSKCEYIWHCQTKTEVDIAMKRVSTEHNASEILFRIELNGIYLMLFVNICIHRIWNSKIIKVLMTKIVGFWNLQYLLFAVHLIGKYVLFMNARPKAQADVRSRRLTVCVFFIWKGQMWHLQGNTIFLS